MTERRPTHRECTIARQIGVHLADATLIRAAEARSPILEARVTYAIRDLRDLDPSVRLHIQELLFELHKESAQYQRAQEEFQGSALPPLVVTRHPALVEYLRERWVIGGDAEIITHADPEQIRERDVIGVLPIHLAALCASYTNVTLNVPQERRSDELTLDDIRNYAGDIVTYHVSEVRRS